MIATQHIFPPIPDRTNDWLAYDDNNEEGPQGWGRTEAEAIADLKMQMEDEDGQTCDVLPPARLISDCCGYEPIGELHDGR